MAQFDVFSNAGGQGYLLDVQSDLLSGLTTRMVVPLLPKADSPTPAEHLNPIFKIDGQQFVMTSQFMAAVPLRELKGAVDNLSDQRQQIMGALDFLFVGF